MLAWAILMRSENKLDGYRQHFDGTTNHPCRRRLFETRKEAREFIKQHYAYFKRPDLRAEPHGWKMPLPVRVKVEVTFA
jgi:hypothetical protein